MDKKDAAAVHIEHVGSDTPTDDKVQDLESYAPTPRNIDEGYDPKFVQRTMRKIDWRLLPILIAMHAISLIDRTNLSLARQANHMLMDQPTQLGTKFGDRYSIITLVFFPPYILLEIPSQIGLRKFGARIWLSAAVVLWGLAMVGMGRVNSWSQLAGLRVLLGCFEATLFPGATYLISCWYSRRQMATRNGIFYTASATIGSLSALVGYTFSLLNGKANQAGWQWVFTLYGIITVLIGVVAYFALVDFPDTAKFLTQEEREFVHTRIQRDRGDAVADPVTLRKVGAYLCEVKLWLFGIFFMSATIAAYSLAYFLPVILATMGFSNFESMVLGCPTHLYAVIPSIACSIIADRYKGKRYLMVVLNALMLILGTAMFSQLPKSQKAARFVGVFLATGASTANIPLVMSWAQTSIRQQSKRAVTSGVVIAWGGIGGLLAGAVFRQAESKKSYPTGIWFTIGVNVFTTFGSIGLALWFKRQNRRADRGEVVLEGNEDFRYQT